MAVAYGDELVTIVQIDQPLCAREYGDLEQNSPAAGCTALLGTSGTRKCYNTRATCQDSANYDPGTLTLSFARTQEGLEYLGYVIPSLESINTTPMRINIGAMDKNLSPFGAREAVTMVFSDHLHSDHKVDKYRLERHTGDADQDGAYDPYERGTYWRKWLARNPYHEGDALRVYQGTVGQALAEMEVRHYVIDKINGPSNGRVTVTAKDLFAQVEAHKAVAPFASEGELAADITAAATSFALSPTGIGDLDYGTSGHVAVGDEAMSYTRTAGSDTLSVTRGALNTVAAAHDREDRVQVVLVYSAQQAQNITEDLLTTYGGVAAARIPSAAWDTEAADNFSNLYTAYIAEPTPIEQLIGELAEQAGFSIWPDVRTNQIELKALVPASAGAIDYTVDDDAWIKAGTLSIKRVPDQRVSEVWIYYGKINPLEDEDKKSNYRSRLIVADLNAEDSTQYGTAAIREVFSRWIAQFGRTAADDVGDRILAMFRDPPFRATFDLHAARDGLLELANPFRLDTEEVTDDTGDNKLTTHLPIKLSRSENLVHVESQQLQFFIDSAAGSPADSERVLYIDQDTNNFNIRTEHDALFQAPVSGDIVRVRIAAGVVVGSSSTGTPAMQSGSWPTGIEIFIENLGRIAGAGGGGGKGGLKQTGESPDGLPGEAGGLALSVAVAVKFYNIDGVIAGGGGGGGGGASAINFVHSGGGGGGGAGRAAGTAGTGGNNNATDGTLTAAGAGGSGVGDGGTGGAGGAPGQVGSSGASTADYTGGAAGAAGAAISGVSNISWVDANDSPTADDGTILGATS